MSTFRGLQCMLLLAMAGCTCVQDPTDHAFPCANDSTCADGYACVEGFCTLPGDADAGDDDAGMHVMDAGAPDAGTHDAGVQENCTDGVDNNGDGLVDCEDPDCALKRCQPSSLSDFVCCSQSPTGCVALSSADNCGGCGIQCTSGALCVEQPVAGGFSGYCACNVEPACPSSGAGVTSAQTCFAGSACACSTNDGCAAGETCDHSLAYGVCRY
jgi:hypothetical protein